MSKSFDAYSKIRNDIKGLNNPNVYVSSFAPSSKNPGDGVFYINNKEAKESVAVTLSPGGVLKKANYIDKTIEDGDRTTFIAKDLQKLKETVRDQATYDAAAVMDWTKVPVRTEAVKEAVVDVVEEEEPEFE